jgi:DNA polymerase-3 subunit epsilon
VGALADLEVLMVDCQTTGATPALGALLEIGWTVARAAGPADPVQSHRVALPEGEAIPRIVSRITGLVDDGGAGAIDAEQAWRMLRTAADGVSPRGSGVPTVIHFARFELAFLRDLHARYEPDAPFPLEVVCAHEIARRLFPDLPRRGLRALAGYFGHGLSLERRSGGHVEATACVWRHLASELGARGVHRWSDLASWLEEPAPTSRERRAFPMPRALRLSLPDAPGVYRLLRSNGDILYVGKAASLKRRVSSHFTRGGRAHERALEMLTQARDIAVTETATPLEAAMLESDEIKRHDPPYNVQLRTRDRSAWFASRDLAAAAPAPDHAHRLGPLPSRLSLAPLAAVRALLCGEEPTELLRARAVGVPSPYAPEPAPFAEGWAAFVAQHLVAVRSRTPWGVLLKASKALWRLWNEAGLDETDEGDAPEAWDADRVRRHLERAVLLGGQLSRRARWLCLLSESVVAFRDLGARRRLLSISAAEVVERRDLSRGDLLPEPVRAPRWHERQTVFDAAAYDRMRVLATELKRVMAETGDVQVRLNAKTELRGEALARVLRWV